MPVTNGTISLSRRVRTGDDEYIEPHVSVSFNADGGEDPEKLAHLVAVIVDQQYKFLLGAKDSVPASTGEVKTTRKKPEPKDIVIGAPASSPVPADPMQVAPQPAPVPASSPPATAPAVSTDPMAAGQPAPATVTSPTPTVMPPATTGDPMAGPTSSAPAVNGHATDASPSAQNGIADTEITTAISRKADQLAQLYGEAGLPKVVALVESIVGPRPARATMMTQPQRVDFLAKLATLS